MQAERPLSPELDHEWSQAIAGPVWRSGNRTDCEFRGVKRNRLLEGVGALERRRLLAGPGTDLGEPRPRREISISFRIFDSLHRAAQPHLPIDRLPMKEQRGFVIAIELLSLSALDVGVEHEAVLAEALH